MSGPPNAYAIVGGTLWGNRGAEAMVATTIGEVRTRDTNARFLLFSYLPEPDRELLQDPHVAVVDARPRTALLVHVPFAIICWLLAHIGVRLADVLLPAPVRRLRRCRALFDVSGISFHDGRLAVVAYNIVCLWPALLLGVPVVRLSQATGPFERTLNRMPARWITRAATHTFARGRDTADYLRQLGIPGGRWSVAADVAFAYREGFSLTEENSDRLAAVHTTLGRRSGSGHPIAALVPSSLVHEQLASQGRDYVAVLDGLIDHLHTCGYDVLVLPNATRQRSAGLRNNDIAVIRLHRDRRADRPASTDDAPTAVFVDFDLNTAGIRALLRSCEVVVTSRFHAMVAGLSLGIPVLAIGWSHKYLEVLEMFDRSEDALPMDSDLPDLQQAIDRLLLHRGEARRSIAAAWPAVLASARSQFDILARLP